jgi:hypothetical protein
MCTVRTVYTTYIYIYHISYPWSKLVDFTKREADNSLLPNAEVKNCGAIPPLSHTSSWRRVN